MTTRRNLLRGGTTLALAAAAHRVLRAQPRTPSLLILGGTGFIGPHLTQAALRAGWRVTHFNRGQHATPQGGVETLIGDRKDRLDALRGRRWDAVIDDTGYVPRFVKASAELLAPNVGYYLFISSISVYKSFAAPNDERSAVAQLSNPDVEEVTGDTYGGLKVLCERHVQETFSDRAAIVRPGYIVGPLDPSDRFTYWPVRVSRGGEMLAPGTPRDPIQVIDVRDLAAWLMTLTASRTTGCFNAISPPGALSMGELLETSRREIAHPATQTWVPEDFLARVWKPEELDLPPWAPVHGDTAGQALTSTTLARHAGLTCRPLRETVHDTLAWFRTLPPERQAKLHAGLSAQKEADTLRAWHANSPQAAG